MVFKGVKRLKFCNCVVKYKDYLTNWEIYVLEDLVNLPKPRKSQGKFYSDLNQSILRLGMCILITVFV